jgi:hypothetical protein
MTEPDGRTIQTLSTREVYPNSWMRLDAMLGSCSDPKT